jgi:hypothetical protein
MFPFTGNYKLQSAARPDRHVTYINGKIVTNDEMEGPTSPDEVRSILDYYSPCGFKLIANASLQWHVQLHESSLFTFESVRDGESSGLYITVEVSCPPSHHNGDLMLLLPRVHL